VEEMLEKTDTEIAPWQVIPSNFKWYTRIQVLRTTVKTLEKTIGKP
jgi:polyphosphate kinase 2 (PPK2 family)